MREPVNHARLVVDLRFEGTYFHPGELVDVATGWIHAGLDDRDNLLGVEISGQLLVTCAHCGEVIEGDGRTWPGPIPEPGQDPDTVPRYHASPEFPDCRRASGAFGDQA
ncbi:hypothetical protein ACWDTT_33310 [Streptosporangium sandarakinum]